MPLVIRNMSENFAVQILNWKYHTPYDFYNNELNLDTLKEMLENSYYIVLDQNDKLVGFFCIGNSAKVPIGIQFGAYSEELIDIGIGMKPELTMDGQVVGAFRFYRKKTQNKISLYQFAISEAYRGTGLLKKMLTRINDLPIVALCPTDSKFNNYFQKTEWELQAQNEEFKMWVFNN